MKGEQLISSVDFGYCEVAFLSTFNLKLQLLEYTCISVLAKISTFQFQESIINSLWHENQDSSFWQIAPFFLGSTNQTHSSSCFKPNLLFAESKSTLTGCGPRGLLSGNVCPLSRMFIPKKLARGGSQSTRISEVMTLAGTLALLLIEFFHAVLGNSAWSRRFQWHWIMFNQAGKLVCTRTRRKVVFVTNDSAKLLNLALIWTKQKLLHQWSCYWQNWNPITWCFFIEIESQVFCQLKSCTWRRFKCNNRYIQQYDTCNFNHVIVHVVIFTSKSFSCPFDPRHC